MYSSNGNFNCGAKIFFKIIFWQNITKHCALLTYHFITEMMSWNLYFKSLVFQWSLTSSQLNVSFVNLYLKFAYICILKILVYQIYSVFFFSSFMWTCSEIYCRFHLTCFWLVYILHISYFKIGGGIELKVKEMFQICIV